MAYTLNWAAAAANGTFALMDGAETLSVTVATANAINGQTASIRTFGADSGLGVSGLTEAVTTTITFDRPISNLSFSALDIDSSAGGWDDKLTIIATNAAGEEVPITFGALNGVHSVQNGNILNADGNFSTGVEGVGARDSVDIGIAGPITSIRFIMDNGESVARSGMFGISNLRFERLVPDGVVEGSAGADLIDGSYLADPEGDRIDANDATGFGGTTGQADYILAGAGNDTVNANLGDDVVYGEAGDDLLSGGAGQDSLYGGEGDDTLSGGAGDNLAEGGAGSDLFQIGRDNGTTTITGGASAGDLDTLAFDAQGAGGVDVTFTGSGAGSYAFNSGGSGGTFIDIERLTGSAGDDSFDATLATLGISILAGAGNDTLKGGSGADTLQGGDGEDRFVAGAGDVVDGGEGGTDTDTLVAVNVAKVTFDPLNREGGILTFADNSTMSFTNIEKLLLNAGTPDGVVQGTAAADLIGAGYVDRDGDIIDAGDSIYPQSGTDADEIYAGDGNDTVFALEANDSIYGGAGDDQLYGGNGDDYVEADAGNDAIYAGDGNDFIRGKTGDDTLYGGAGNDNVFGGFDNDALYGDAGRDTLFGFGGRDTIYGGDDADLVYGGEDASLIHGDDGDDNLNGDEGRDTIYGGAGNDTLVGNADADVLYGAVGDYIDGSETGDDNDSLYVTDVASVRFDTNNPENGTVTFNGGGTLVFYNIEKLFVDGVLTGSRDYIVTGTAGDDLIDTAYTGDPQGDRIDASDARNGSDDDVVEAGSGDDTVFSGAGNDILTGGAGADSLAGGDDRDTFFVDAGDRIDGGEGGDDDDTLDLRAYGKDNVHIIYDADNPENGVVEFLGSNGLVTGSMRFSNIENVIPCFTPGTRILAEQGEVEVEALRVGDRVLTRDHGYQEIRWIGRRDLGLAELIAEPRFSPVRISQGALGEGLPERDMRVSPQHRMLLVGGRAEMMFGEHEVLVAATHMVGTIGVNRVFPREISYIHILFDQHEIVQSDGCWSESFQPGAQSLCGLEAGPRAELLALFPELAAGQAYPAARLTLKAHEARLMLQSA